MAGSPDSGEARHFKGIAPGNRTLHEGSEMPVRALLLLVVLSFVTGREAFAHNAGQSYVYLNVTEDDRLHGRFELALQDVNRVLPLDSNGDGKVSMDEYEASKDKIGDYLRSRLLFRHDGKDIRVTLTDTLDVLPTGPADYIRHRFDLPELSPAPKEVEVRFDFLYNDGFPSHMGMVIIENNPRTGLMDNEAAPAALFRPGNEWRMVSFDPEPFGRVLYRFIGEGVWHIWIGLDHILFIIALLLPSVLVLDRGRWRPAESFRQSLWYVTKVATLFTLAHSITLSLASLNIVSVPSSPVEAVIALSIAVTAYGNLRPFFEGRAVWFIIFIFGLFHGFGFASVLAPLGLNPSSLVAGLLGFNIGVELGQIAIIAVAFPVLFVLRRTVIYRPLILYAGSIALIGISLFWFVERSMHVYDRAKELGYL